MSQPVYEECFDTCAALCQRSQAHVRAGQRVGRPPPLFRPPDEMPDAAWREREELAPGARKIAPGAPVSAQGAQLALRLHQFK